MLLSNGGTLDYDNFLEQLSAIWQQFECEAVPTCIEYSSHVVAESFLRKALGATPPATLVTTFRDMHLRDWGEGMKSIEGVPTMLSALAKRFTLALVTNTHSADFVRSYLRMMEIDKYFSVIVTSVEFGKRKPDPSIFLHALELTGGEPRTAVHIGDSFAADYVGATAAGVRCLLIDPEKRAAVSKHERVAHILDISQVLGSAE